MSQKIMNGIDGSQLWLHFNYTASVVSSLRQHFQLFLKLSKTRFLSRVQATT